MAKDAIALVEHLKWDHCHVVGISMGGMIALEFVLLAPEKAISLSLLATHAGGLAGRAPFSGIRHMTRAIFLRDEGLLAENALAMLYGSKTLNNPEKRKVKINQKRLINMKIFKLFFYFLFSIYIIIILNVFDNVNQHQLLVS